MNTHYFAQAFTYYDHAHCFASDTFIYMFIDLLQNPYHVFQKLPTQQNLLLVEAGVGCEKLQGTVLCIGSHAGRPTEDREGHIQWAGCVQTYVHAPSLEGLPL